jgi:predicted nucleotidyltransferase
LRIADYKKHWDRMAREERSENERLRLEALKVALRLKDILVKEFKVDKVILFGSVLQKRRFNRYSDIDLAVAGLAKQYFFRAFARLMMESEFEVDLKPVEDLEKGMIGKRIMKGEVLYEKRKAS